MKKFSRNLSELLKDIPCPRLTPSQNTSGLGAALQPVGNFE
jgi:hypothetical protein